MAIVNGTAGNDIGLIGTEDDDLLFGLAGSDNLVGDLGDDFLDGGPGNDNMVGEAGDDVYIVGSTADSVVEEENGGYDVVFASASFRLPGDVEDLILTGTAALNGTGNASANVLVGNSAANVLDGGGGADEMTGGAGNDTYVVDNAGDIVIEFAGGGTDLVRASLTGYTLADDVENLTLFGMAMAGYGNSAANVITGSDGDNQLHGGAGNDRLIGGIGNDILFGDDGSDTTEGGAGNDIHVVDQATDVAVELANGGIDTVRAFISYTLGANFENLVLMGAATNGTGNAAANTIMGNQQDNMLAGLGGADILNGGEMMGWDRDTASYAASAAAVIVNLATGTGTGGDAQGDTLINIEGLIGSAFNDILTGDDRDNTIDGGAGNDLMNGGLGDDTYTVNSSGDVVTDTGGTYDTVYASVSHRLNGGVENLWLTGSLALDGIGSSAANLIAGNSGSNMLIGLSGDDLLYGDAGSDLLVGGSGDDLLYGDPGADRLMGGAGTDTVVYYLSEAAVNVNLRTGAGTGGDAAGDRLSSIEMLSGSRFDDLLTGSARNETIDGWDGNDTLRGGGGNDILQGGGGYDQLFADFGPTTMTGGAGSAGGDDVRDDFFFVTPPDMVSNADKITDFEVGLDRLKLDLLNMFGFDGLSPGQLNANNFKANATGTATQFDDFVTYNTATGDLYFDGDGSGAGGRLLFAQLTGAPALTAADIDVLAPMMM